MTNIFIANLDFDITSDDLKATFSQFGTVSYAHVVFDNKSKRSKGYGYVEMENPNEAEAAVKSLNGMEVNGRALDVKIATPKGERKPSTSKWENKSKKGDKPPFKKDDRPFKKKPREDDNRPKVHTVKDAEQRRVLRPRRNRNKD